MHADGRAYIRVDSTSRAKKDTYTDPCLYPEAAPCKNEVIIADVIVAVLEAKFIPAMLISKLIRPSTSLGVRISVVESESGLETAHRANREL